GKRQGNTRSTLGQASGNGSPSVAGFGRSAKSVSNVLFVPGMRLEGCGIDPLKGKEERLFHQTGTGTSKDPMVAWLQQQRDASQASLQAHADIVRAAAKAKGFKCALIRKEMHDRECTYDEFGRRNVYTFSNGRTQAMTAASDNHITVWMGEHPKRILVSGHIYVIMVKDPKGNLIPRPMNDPANQRTKALIQPGRGMVSEEFWLTRDTWERLRN
ncbi:hypothetical protein B0I37DRAFT_439211, partial [Chaetomium sp. MPI-CAGE-AT-0009]